jgi:integrase
LRVPERKAGKPAHPAALHSDGLASQCIDRTVIALWLGHESIETTQIYIHADMRLKENALARVVATKTRPGRYKPDDTFLKFLESL